MLEWSTDILTAEAAEQRIALRPLPREIVSFRHRLDALGMGRAETLARAAFGSPWLVPLWHMGLQPSAPLVGASYAIDVDTTISDFRAGDYVAVAVRGRDAGIYPISAVAGSGLSLDAPLVLPTETVHPAAAVVMPVRAGILSSAVDVDRRRQGDGTVSATFLLRDAPALEPLADDTYLGVPVLSVPSLLRRSLASSHRRMVEYVDNGSGPVEVEPLQDWFDRRDTITRKAQGPAARWALRRWLYGMRGRQAAFWLPTWGRELQLTAPMMSGSVLMNVHPLGPVDGYAGRRIVVETSAGLRYRTINGATDEGSEHRLTLSSSLGVAIPVETRAHFMVPVRSDSDRLEIQHRGVLSETNFPLIEVPDDL